MTGTPIDLLLVGFTIGIAPTLFIGGFAAISAWRNK
jgi:hypothetical protein